MRGPFPPIRHRKHRKYTEYSRCFLYCLDEKTLSQNCFAPQKVRFLCRTRRKAQEYWLCIPSIFNEVRREKILFAAIASLSCTPFRRGVHGVDRGSLCHLERSEAMTGGRRRAMLGATGRRARDSGQGTEAGLEAGGQVRQILGAELLHGPVKGQKAVGLILHI